MIDNRQRRSATSLKSNSMPMDTFSKPVRRMLGFSLDAWNSIMIGSLVIAAFAAVCVGMSTWIIVRLQKQEAIDSAKQFDKYKLGVEDRVAEAKKEGIEAGKTAGNAILRAAELEKEAASARLETEKIKSAVSWRVIPPDAIKKLGEALRRSPGVVNLRYTDGDPEALFMAIQLSRILEASGWSVAPGSAKPPNMIVFGIRLSDNGTKPAELLRDAFSFAGIPFSTEDVPAGAMFNVQIVPNAPTLYVGSKVPPSFD